MRSAVFVAPFALAATLRFVRAALGLPGLRLGLVSQEPVDRLPEDVRHGIAGFARVDEALDPVELADAVTRIGRDWHAPVERLLGILEQLQVPLAEARERLDIPGMSVAAAHNFRDKSRMKDVLRAHGVPCARHRLAAGPEAALAFADVIGGPLVVKPPAGAGAKQTVRVENREQLADYLRSTTISPQQPLLLEEFITGHEHSFDSVTLEGRHLLHSVTRYYPTPLEVMEKPWLQWCVVLPRHVDRPEFAPIFEAGPRALDCLGLVTGITHMEWFRRPDGSIAISEVAARPPGAQFTSLLSYAHDLDFYRAWSELMLFDRFPAAERRWAVGAAFLRGMGSGKVKAVHGVEEARQALGDLVAEAKLPRPGQAQASSYEGEGYVILKHAETEAVERGLAQLLRTLRIEMG